MQKRSTPLRRSGHGLTTCSRWWFARAATRGAWRPPMRSAIWSVDKDEPIVRVATMDNLLAASEAERRFALILFEAFALVALVLAATGCTACCRRRRRANARDRSARRAGASRGNILALVVRQGMTLAGLGVAIGLAGSGRRQPGHHHAAVRRLAARSHHLSRRDRVAGCSLGHRLLDTGVACGTGGSLDHVAGGIVAMPPAAKMTGFRYGVIS